MKRYYFSIIILLLTTQVLISQWQWQNPRPHGYTLTDMCFINNKTGYACGIGGVVQKTTDGGLSYNYQYIDTTQLTSIFFFNEYKGIIAGPFGRIYLTTDGGNSYFLIRNNYDEVLFRIVFSDSSNGWLCGWRREGGGFVLHSTDGGYQWKTQLIVPDGDVLGLSFISSTTGFACTNQSGKVFKTTDGGKNWLILYNNQSLNFFTLYFIDQNTGFVGGFDGKVIRTTDGGFTWNLFVNSYFEDLIFDIKFLDVNTGFISAGKLIVPATSYILRTTDGGDTWSISYQSTEWGEFAFRLFLGLFPIIRGVGIHGISLVSYDLGNSWERENFVTYAALRRVIFLNSQTGWAWGDYVSSCDVLKTTNGGDNWSVKFNSANKVGSIYFLDLQNGYYTNSAGEIFRTTNGGDNWIKIYQLPNNYLTDMYFINSQSGWVCGDSGRVLRTTNGGQSWEYQSVGYNYRMIRIKFFDENRGWALANYSKIFRTTNGGVNWNAINLSSNFDFYSMSFPSDSVGFVGAYGFIYRTSNGGLNWTTTPIGYNVPITSIYFLNCENGFAYGGDGHFYKTTDCGRNWLHYLLDKYAGLAYGDITFIDENTGWFAGTCGIILKTTNGGTVFVNRIKESIPDDYKLYQNYPNPFNAVTNIKYSLPRDSYVRLEVYDILGRRIKVLVDEQQKAGTYQVTFFADDLSSGVYFYRLEIDGNKTISKRMVFIK